MEEPKTYKFIDWDGKEKTWIIDPSLNGAAERTKLPKKVIEANKRLKELEDEIKKIPWS